MRKEQLLRDQGDGGSCFKVSMDMTIHTRQGESAYLTYNWRVGIWWAAPSTFFAADFLTFSAVVSTA